MSNEKLVMYYKKIVNEVAAQFINGNYTVDYTGDVICKNSTILYTNTNDKVFDQILSVVSGIIGSNFSENAEAFSYDFNRIIKEINSDLASWIEKNSFSSISVESLNIISNMKYESTACSGNFALLDSASAFNPHNLFFEIPFCLDEYQIEFSFEKKELKYIRKLLQVANDNMSLVLEHTNEKNWRPLGYAKKCGNLTQISIIGKEHWQFVSGKNSILYKQGKFCIAKDNPYLVKNIQYKDEIEQLAKVVKNIDTEKLSSLIEKITKDSKLHGALFVFVDQKQKRKIDELCSFKRGIKIDNKNSSEKLSLNYLCENTELLFSLCKIDGALIFDNDGNLLAMGTILDGCALKKGNISRGSRFNSTKTFIDYYTRLKTQKNIQCCGLVISEDQYVNVLIPE